MTNITVTFTEDQAWQLLRSLDNDYIDNDKSSQAFILRIEDKVIKALAKAKS